MRHLIFLALLLAPAQPPRPSPPPPSPQPRPHAARVAVSPAQLQVDDGDTVVIRWAPSDAEQVRILGIDTPETRHVEHDLPYDQAFGLEAQAFARGAFAAAERIELRRTATLDPFGRSLGYLWIDGRNYSVMVVAARLAEESITRYGDNGLPQEAAEVMAAARKAGPLPFESPATFRARMRDVSRWMKENGTYPAH
jgi:endonuclease YncB( thermonuclease family)